MSRRVYVHWSSYHHYERQQEERGGWGKRALVFIRPLRLAASQSDKLGTLIGQQIHPFLAGYGDYVPTRLKKKYEMARQYQDISTVDSTSYTYVFEQNVSVPLKEGGVLRCNVYRPKTARYGDRFPVIATLGPYEKMFLIKAHQTEHSAWETPTPSYWTAQGYVVVRADEPGVGQSPWFLDFLSNRTVDSFCELIEWAAVQSWSTGKVGLLGVSYYAAMQWPVAARNPKVLAAIIPWEGFSDLYSEAYRHGGILSNNFFQVWYSRQIAPNQYGLPGRAARNWGPDTVDGDLTEEELKANRATHPDEYHQLKFRDDQFFARTHFNLEDVRVPVLSVASWGGIFLYLRGNLRAFTLVASEFKYLRFIVGRHDLSFYYPEEIEVQRGFLDAFLKGDDKAGWATRGKLPAVDMVIRRGNVGFNDRVAEATFLRRGENEWPLARTQYSNFYLTGANGLNPARPDINQDLKMTYDALEGAETNLTFQTEPFPTTVEITGHIVAHLHVSVDKGRLETIPSEMDIFVSLRHISPHGEEVLYTGSVGGGVPATKGFLRLSLRKTNPSHPHHRPWLPYREYRSSDVVEVVRNEVYAVDIELWPTNLVVETGGRLLFEVGSKDTAGSELWLHTDPVDRSENKLRGLNHLHFGPNYTNFICLPFIPSE
ncbi:putative Xaa-Pro dipeptidyl-peptidase C-terminal domain-containing protein [Seiridium cardinale]|uniref:Xaa-Pro dipeptidyl-peptidase C-terminal domain-containing protein n=1 Tax=Seiridium cardinale TaxID=138064 RepID=A0ABR2XXD5_9PEZI